MLTMKVVTPKGVTFERQVSEIQAPGINGEFGILQGHIPFISAIQPGEIKWKAHGADGKIAVDAGYAEISASGEVLILVQKATPL